MGLLVWRQTGRHRDRQPVRQGDGTTRRGARRRRVLGSAWPHRGVERGDGRGSLSDTQMERIRRRVTPPRPCYLNLAHEVEEVATRSDAGEGAATGTLAARFASPL